jgi:hypothetical protein
MIALKNPELQKYETITVLQNLAADYAFSIF